MPIVTLTTDFGTSDHYVACMKGVILQETPAAQIVDVTHSIRRHDILQAAFVLRQTFDCFPAGTIHVVVVDPGVGTPRRLLAIKYSGQIVLAPDNGVVSLVHRDFVLEDIREIGNRQIMREKQSNTFHGRDVLAPAAGFLASGGGLYRVGEPVGELELINLRAPTVMGDGAIEGRVVYIDSFGNCITNISREDVIKFSQERVAEVYVGPTRIGPLQATYADVDIGEPIALIGSADCLEIAVNQGSAADMLKATPGTRVFVR